MVIMCGRVIQSSAPFRLAIVEGLDVRDSRVHNYPGQPRSRFSLGRQGSSRKVPKRTGELVKSFPDLAFSAPDAYLNFRIPPTPRKA